MVYFHARTVIHLVTNIAMNMAMFLDSLLTRWGYHHINSVKAAKTVGKLRKLNQKKVKTDNKVSDLADLNIWGMKRKTASIIAAFRKNKKKQRNRRE